MRGIILQSWDIIVSGPRTLAYLFLTVLFVAAHSFFLGAFIYFFTEVFYSVFFAPELENIFFVRQSGLFLMLSALFYLYPLIDFSNNRGIVPLIIVSKCAAVIFLLTNARSTSAPTMLFLAALGDGTMALLLAFYYRACRQKQCFD